MQRGLPHNLTEFMNLVQHFFGASLFDLKVIAQLRGLHGGLEEVATSLGLNRVGGDKSHQAGPDSLLTMQVFVELCKRNSADRFFGYNNKFYGLTRRPV